MLSLQAVTMAPSTEMSQQERDELIGQLKVGNVSVNDAGFNFCSY